MYILYNCYNTAMIIITNGLCVCVCVCVCVNTNLSVFYIPGQGHTNPKQNMSKITVNKTTVIIIVAES